MFDVWCPRERARVLLTTRRIERLVQADGRIDLHIRCWCGARAVLRTGRAREAAREPAGGGREAA